MLYMHKFVSSNMFMTILVTYILDQIKNQRRCGKSCGDVHFKGKSGEMFAAATGDGIDMYRWEIIDDRDEDCPDFIEYC